jgi:hypothetical protein
MFLIHFYRSFGGGGCRNGRIAAIPFGELIFFGLGTGEYHELALCSVLHAIIGAYSDLHKGQVFTDGLFFQSWAQTIFVIDEVCKEGYVEHIDQEALKKALAFKIPKYAMEQPDSSRGGLRSFSMKSK